MRVSGHSVFEAKAGDIVEITLPPKSPFISSGSVVYLASSSRVKGAYHYEKPKAGIYAYHQPVNVVVKVKADSVCAICENWKAELKEKFSPAQNTGKANAAIRQAFEKVGNTPLKLNDLQIENPQNLFVPLSLLNELRRKLYEQIEIKQEGRFLPSVETKDHKFKGYIIKTDKPENLPDLSDIVEVIIVLSPDTKSDAFQNLPKNKVRLVLPAVCRNPKVFENIVKSALNAGYKKWEIGNVWALEILPQKGIDLTFDNSIYAMNTQAIQMAKQMGASRVTMSFEDTFENLADVATKAALPVVLPIYSNVPLFISANCIRQNDCKHCKGGKEWFNLTKDNQKYEALSVPCQTMVFNQKAFYIGNIADKIGADYLRIDFTYKDYTPEQIENILRAVKDGKNLPNTYSGNLQRRI